MRPVIWAVICLLLVSSIQAVSIEEALQSENEVPAIIVLKDQVDGKNLERTREIVRESTDDIEDLMQSRYGRITKTYETVPVVAATLTQEGVQALSQDPNVDYIAYDEEYQIFLNDSIPIIQADQAHTKSISNQSLDGTGQSICIIDTGIDANHTDFTGKILGGYDAIYGDSIPDDDHGHGTHVSATAMGPHGVAPGANVVPVKVCNSFGSCPSSAIIAGIDYCTTNQAAFNISVLSGSLGGGLYETLDECPTLYDVALKNAKDAGITNIFASGNFGSSTRISSPACSPHVISVGSTTKSDTISSFSNLGQLLDVLAPGSDIVAASWGGGNESMSGTSMATPHVAGAMAVMKQHVKLRNGNVSGDLLLTKLKQYGTPIGGYPRINLLDSLEFGLPFAFKFDSTTDFSSESNLDSVSNLFLTKDNATVNWTGPINASMKNFDNLVNMGEDFIAVDSNEATLNQTAKLSFQVPACNMEIYLTPNFTSTSREVLDANMRCDGSTSPSCTNIQCSNNIFSFDVSHFTSFAVSANATLAGYDQGDPEGGSLATEVGTPITFYANFTDPIAQAPLNGTCSLTLNTSSNMSFDGQLYSTQRNFSTPFNGNYNITCSHPAKGTLQVTDSINVVTPNSVICGDQVSTNVTLNSDLRNSTGGSDCPFFALNITADDITIDCNNFQIKGPDDGILLNERSGVMIKQCGFQNFFNAVHSDSSSLTLQNNLFNNSDSAIRDKGSDINDWNNTYNSGLFGLNGDNSTINIHNNSYINNTFSIYLEPGSALIDGNSFTGGQTGVDLEGGISALVVNNEFRTDSEGVYLDSVNGVVIENNSFYDLTDGIELFFTANVLIKNNSFIGAFEAIDMFSATNTSIPDNFFKSTSIDEDTGSIGLVLTNSHLHNTFTDLDGHNGTILGNTLNSSSIGVGGQDYLVKNNMIFDVPGTGIVLSSVGSGHKVINNTIRNSDFSIDAYAPFSVMVDNTIINTSDGFYLTSSSGHDFLIENNTLADVANPFIIRNGYNFRISHNSFNNLQLDSFDVSDADNVLFESNSLATAEFTDSSIILDIQPIANYSLDNTSLTILESNGKIEFNPLSNSGDNMLSSFFIIHELIRVDNPDFNSSARITFYNVSKVQPHALKNNQTCTDCTNPSFNGNFSVDVTGFSTYTLAENGSVNFHDPGLLLVGMRDLTAVYQDPLNNSINGSCSIVLDGQNHTMTYNGVNYTASHNFSVGTFPVFVSCHGLPGHMSAFDIGSVTAANENIALTVDKSSTQSVYNFSDLVRFTVNVTNIGEHNLSFNVTDNFDSTLSFITASISPTINGQSLNWIFNDIMPNASQVLTVDFNASLNGSAQNDVFVIGTAPSGNTTNNTDSFAYTILPPIIPPPPENVAILVQKTAQSPNMNVSENNVFTINITNTGNTNLTTLNVTDTFDTAFVSYQSSTPTATVNGNVANWITNLNLQPGQSQIYTITLQGANQGTTNNQVSVIAIAPSTNSTTGADSVVFTVNTPPPPPVPAVQISKVGPSQVVIGSPITYTITVTNTGQTNLISSNVTDVLPAGQQYMSSSLAPNINGQILTWVLPQINIGQQSQFTVTVNTTQLGSPTNSVNVVSIDGNSTVNAADGHLVSILASPPIAPSGVTLGDLTIGGRRQARNVSITGQMSIVSGQNRTITGFNHTLPPEYNIQVQFPQTLVENIQDVVNITITIPKSHDAVDENCEPTELDVGAFYVWSGLSVSNNARIRVQAENMLRIDDAFIEGHNLDDKLDDGDDIKVKIEESFDLTFEVENLFDEDVDITFDEVELRMETDSDDIDVDEENDDIRRLDAEDKDELTGAVDIDDNAEDGSNDVEIYVCGEDENGAMHGEYWNLDFDVDKESHEVLIDTLQVSPSSISCERPITFVEVTVQNTGKSDEDDVFIKVMGLEQEERVNGIKLDESDKTRRTLELSGKDLEPGKYELTIQAGYDNVATDKKIESIFVDKCIETKEVKQVQPTKSNVLLTTNNVPTVRQVQPVQQQSFVDTPEFIMAFFALLLLSMLVVILGLVAFFL